MLGHCWPLRIPCAFLVVPSLCHRSFCIIWETLYPPTEILAHVGLLMLYLWEQGNGSILVVHRWMNDETIVHIQNQILSSHKEIENLICRNTDGTMKYTTKWKQPNLRKIKMICSTYMWFIVSYVYLNASRCSRWQNRTRKETRGCEIGDDEVWG